MKLWSPMYIWHNKLKPLGCFWWASIGPPAERRKRRFPLVGRRWSDSGPTVVRRAVVRWWSDARWSDGGRR